MILAIDIQYHDTSAVAAGVLFNSWSDSSAVRDTVVNVENIAPYVPGEFYRRELPCIKSLLEEVPEQLSFIVVDGYVYLGEDKKPGLGMYLYKELNETVPVIGAAKSFFHGTEESAKLLRGTSKKPLFITSAGVDQNSAKEMISGMYGDNRNPILLKRADQLCRGLI